MRMRERTREGEKLYLQKSGDSREGGGLREEIDHHPRERRETREVERGEGSFEAWWTTMP